jgi:hypothetical protein
VAVVGITRVGDEKVFAVTDGFTYAGVQLAGGWIDETKFEFSVALDAHAAVGRGDAVLKVVAQAEGVVLET